jgi:hypothetical protein
MSTSGAPITCTFPNGDTHKVEHPPAAQLTVLDIRQKLGSLTPHEAEAIQLFSRGGEGRELTDDEEVMSPGSQLHAIVRDIQAVRKTALRNALLAKDHAGCWARVVPCTDQSLDPRIAPVGELMRLTAINGEYFSFISCEKSLTDGDDKFTPDHYLLHTSEFSVWVKSGTNMSGVPLEGAELEADWFMYADAREEMEDDPRF